MKSTDMDNLLICDHCSQKGCHMYCLKPRLRELPDSPWYCDYCVREFHIGSLLPLAFKPDAVLPGRDARPQAPRIVEVRQNRARRRLVRTAESRENVEFEDLGEPLLHNEIHLTRERSRNNSRRTRIRQNNGNQEGQRRRQRRRNPTQRRRRPSSESFKPAETPSDDISADEQEEKINKLLVSPLPQANQENSKEDESSSTKKKRLRRRKSNKQIIDDSSAERSESSSERSLSDKSKQLKAALGKDSKISIKKVYKSQKNEIYTESGSDADSPMPNIQTRRRSHRKPIKTERMIEEEYSDQDQSSYESSEKRNTKKKKQKSPYAAAFNIPYCGYAGAKKVEKSIKAEKLKNGKPDLRSLPYSHERAMKFYKMNFDQAIKNPHKSIYGHLFSLGNQQPLQVENNFLYG